MTVSHDFSAIEALEKEFSDKREEELRLAVERDLSPLRAQEKEANGRADAQIIHAQAERRKKTGYAVLTAGVGVGAAALGLSFLLPPKIIETTKVVTETKTVEVPKIIEVPKIVETTKVIETQKLIDKPAPPAPIISPPSPAPQIGDRSSTENFTNSDEYKNTLIKGKIISHKAGEIKFDNGRSFIDLLPNGTKDTSITNSRHDGDFGFCAQTGQKLPNGTELYSCQALHNGVVELMSQGVNMQPSISLPQSNSPPQNLLPPIKGNNPNKPFSDMEDDIDRLFEF